jgi:hypothetical protein
MNRFARWTALAGALGFLALAGVAGADEEKIPVKRLPKAVIKAVKAKFPKAEIKEAAKEEEEGETIYEVSLEVKGRSVDVALEADGTILEIEKEVPIGELPESVKKALAAKYPKAKIEKVETISKGEDGPVNYEVVIATEVVLSPKGKFVEADKEEGEEKSSAKSEKEGDEDDEKPAAKKKSEKDEDEDEKPIAKKKSEKDEDEKPIAKKKPKKGEDEDDEVKGGDEDDEKPAAKPKKAKKSKKDEDEDEDNDKGSEKGEKD